MFCFEGATDEKLFWLPRHGMQTEVGVIEVVLISCHLLSRWLASNTSALVWIVKAVIFSFVAAKLPLLACLIAAPLPQPLAVSAKVSKKSSLMKRRKLNNFLCHVFFCKHFCPRSSRICTQHI